jgi:hypothetical protein
MDDANEMETVYTLNNPGVAEIIKNALENEGIACAIENEHQAGLTGVFEIRLLTRASDAERARQIIEAHQQSIDDESDDEE